MLNALKDNLLATQKELAAAIGKSERTVRRLIVSMQEKGLIEREGSRRNGKWIIID